MRCRALDPQLDVVDVSNLQMVLEWKVGWVDGRLDEWLSTDVAEFLLEWCPRKLSAPADIAVEMAESVADAFTFLGEEGLLSAQSQPGHVLAAETRALAPEFFNKMMLLSVSRVHEAVSCCAIQ